MDFSKFNNLVENVKEYIKVQSELALFETEQKVKKKFNNEIRKKIKDTIKESAIYVFEIFVFVAVISIFFLFANLTLAHYLNEVFQHEYAGFLIIAIAQLSSLGVFLFIRRSKLRIALIIKYYIKRFIHKLIDKMFFKDD